MLMSMLMLMLTLDTATTIKSSKSATRLSNDSDRSTQVLEVHSYRIQVNLDENIVYINMLKIYHNEPETNMSKPTKY